MKRLVKPLNTAPVLQNCATPEPSERLATVRIAHVGLCRTDLLVAKGQLSAPDGLVLGHECSGHVVHDPSGQFAAGAPVALNPLLPGEQFLGLHCDGALQDFVQIAPEQLVDAQGVSLKLAAYVEPVAASMAVLKARITPEQKGVIYHANRISHLTFLVLDSLGYNIEWVPAPPSGDCSEVYDYAIETLFEQPHIDAMLRALKRGGLLVVKSRQYAQRPVVPGLLVAKELTLQAVNYQDYPTSMAWLAKHQDLVRPLLGDTYALADWHQAFEAAQAGDAKKIFISLEA